MSIIRANQLNIEEILNNPDAFATETRHGTLEIATQAEATAGVDTLKAITPNTLKNFTGTFEPADATILKDEDIGITIAAFGHVHAGVYEPAFVKNTGFNLNLGTSAGTVTEGNHTHVLGALDDVVLGGSPLTDQVLAYDGTNWVNSDHHTPATTLPELTDVATDMVPTEDQVLAWDDTQTEWTSRDRDQIPYRAAVEPTIGIIDGDTWYNTSTHEYYVRRAGVWERIPLVNELDGDFGSVLLNGGNF